MILTTHPDADIQYNVLPALKDWFARITVNGREGLYFIGDTVGDLIVLYPGDDKANRTGENVLVNMDDISAVYIF